TPDVVTRPELMASRSPRFSWVALEFTTNAPVDSEAKIESVGGHPRTLAKPAEGTPKGAQAANRKNGREDRGERGEQHMNPATLPRPSYLAIDHSTDREALELSASISVTTPSGNW